MGYKYLWVEAPTSAVNPRSSSQGKGVRSKDNKIA